MKNFLLILATILLIGMSVINLWTLNTAERITNAYHETKSDYCSLFKKYDEYFSILDSPMCESSSDCAKGQECLSNQCQLKVDEYSRYFYFKDEFLKYCK